MLFGKLFESSVGRKALMAITGLLLIGFLVVHMLGNLQLFLGPEAFNAYAEMLQSKPGIVWAFRLGLLAIAFIHVVVAISLKRENSAARPVAYVKNSTIKATFASRTMILSGAVILAFIVYHLLHLTTGHVHSDLVRDLKAQGDIYQAVVLSFQSPLISIVYLIAVLLLALHLIHAVQSMFQTLGLNSKRHAPLFNRLSVLVAVVIFAGYSIIPVAIFVGLVR